MYDASRLRRKVQQSGLKRFQLSVGELPSFLLEEREDPWPRRIALVAAPLLLLILFAVRWPGAAPIRAEPQHAKPTYVVRQIRFQPPAARPQPTVPKREQPKRIIPVPDRTPEEPEPIRVLEEVPVEIGLPEGEAIFGVPEAPPGPAGIPEGVIAVTGEVVPPQKIHHVQPVYTEEAREARLQGVVIVQAIIDTMGGVRNVQVLKGLPMGLSESAVAAVQEWRFRPATLHGAPVAVFYNATVNFSLQ